MGIGRWDAEPRGLTAARRGGRHLETGGNGRDTDDDARLAARRRRYPSHARTWRRAGKDGADGHRRPLRQDPLILQKENAL